MFPHLGYSQAAQIIDRNERRKRGLGDVPRAAEARRRRPRAAPWASRMPTGSTSRRQSAPARTRSRSRRAICSASGPRGGRRYFHYKMDRPMLPFFCYLSARWQVKRGDWNGLPIEIYYDAKHPYNVDRMIDATRKSLDYFTAQFSPYQHRQVRILEFPRYARFAQSFANTIPYSESIGFIADLRDPDGHRLCVLRHCARDRAPVVGAPGDRRGRAGRDHDRRVAGAVLGADGDGEGIRPRAHAPLPEIRARRLPARPRRRADRGAAADAGRGSALHPLRQGLAGVLSPARRDRRGESEPRACANSSATRRSSSRRTRRRWSCSTTSVQKRRRRSTSSIDELFAKIVLYDTKSSPPARAPEPTASSTCASNTSPPRPQPTALGKEAALALDDWMRGRSVRAQGGRGRAHRARAVSAALQHITQGKGTIDVVVDAAPFEVGLDPYNKLIDRNPDDNRKRVE